MRQPILTTAFLGLLWTACACAPAPPPTAVSAQRFAAPAAATAQPAPQGYSDAARRIADCLATYPGYDVRTDQVEVSPGVTRPCPL